MYVIYTCIDDDVAQYESSYMNVQAYRSGPSSGLVGKACDGRRQYVTCDGQWGIDTGCTR